MRTIEEHLRIPFLISYMEMEINRIIITMDLEEINLTVVIMLD